MQAHKTWLYLEVDGRTPANLGLPPTAPAWSAQVEAKTTSGSKQQSVRPMRAEQAVLTVEAAPPVQVLGATDKKRAVGLKRPPARTEVLAGAATASAGAAGSEQQEVGPLGGLAKMARLLSSQTSMQAFSDGLSSRAKQWDAQPEALEMCGPAACVDAIAHVEMEM